MTAATGETRRFWTRVNLGAVVPYVLLGVVALVVVLMIGRQIEHHIDAIEAWIERTSPWGVIVFIALVVVLTSLFVPGTVLSIIGGAAFGLGGGVLAVVVGSLIAASLQYLLARYLLRNRIGRFLAGKPSLLAIQQAVQRDEFRLQALVRLTPLNPATTSYVLGAAGVRFSGFFVACFALIPGSFMEVYFGHAGKHLARAAGRHDRTDLLHDAVIVGGLIACILVMVVVSRMARKALAEAVSEAGDTPEPEGDGEEAHQ